MPVNRDNNNEGHEWKAENSPEEGPLCERHRMQVEVGSKGFVALAILHAEIDAQPLTWRPKPKNIVIVHRKEGRYVHPLPPTISE